MDPVLTAAGVAIAVAIAGVIVLYVILRPRTSSAKRVSFAKPLVTKQAPAPPAPPAPLESSVATIIPRDYNQRIENWDDAWRFKQPDEGMVEFSISKPNGLIVVLSSTVGYAKEGYAVVIDQRGSGDQDPYDQTTSVSYVSRLPSINGAATAHALARNVKLGGGRRHKVRVVYDHGLLDVFVDGVRVLRYRDMMPAGSIQYVGLGSSGLISGVGHVTHMMIE